VQLANWIQAHPPELQPIARFLAANIHHVSQKKFEAELFRTADAVWDYVQEKHGDGGIYIFDNGESGKSEAWVLRLVMEREFTKPEHRNFDSIEIVTPSTDLSKINQVILFDDAIFTGLRTLTHLKELQMLGFRGEVIIAVPFITEFAGPLLEKIGREQLGLSVRVISSSVMPSLEDALTRTALSSKQKKFIEDNYGINISSTLFYSDHKISTPGVSTPALMSSIAGIIEEGTVPNPDGSLKTRVPFVPPITPPYR
jgi:hypothetical protein